VSIYFVRQRVKETLFPVQKDNSNALCGYFILCMPSGPCLETRNDGRLLQVKVCTCGGRLTINATCQTLMSTTTSSVPTSSIINRLILGVYEYKL